MGLFVFSDAHLGSASEEKEAQKIANIRRLFDVVKTHGQRLVILGDLFDFWFEYKHAIPKEHHETLVMLTELVQHGVQVDYVSGNHDFWMDDFFHKHIGVTVHRDVLEIEHEGVKLHLTHGDGLAPADRGYRFLKKVLRSRFNIWLYRKLPPDWAIPLAKAVSGSSREYTSRRDHTFAPDYEAYARRKLAEGFGAVVIGHLHIPVHKEFPEGIYINTGDFIHHFSYARLEGGSISLRYLDE